MHTRAAIALALLIALSGCARDAAPTPQAARPSPTAEPATDRPATQPPGPTAEPAMDTPATQQPQPPTLTPAPPLTADDENAVERAAAEGLVRDPVELARIFEGRTPTPLEPTPQPAIGEERTFWMTDVAGGFVFQQPTTLRYADDQLLIYAAADLTTDQAALEQVATVYRERTVPGLLALYGATAPEVPQVTLLLAPAPGVSGYYSADNELPPSVFPSSNGRPMVTLNSSNMQPGTENFDRVLAHELQHLLHERLRRDSAIWINEGLSTLAEVELGYGPSPATQAYLANPDTQVNTWNTERSLQHYGAAALLLGYAKERRGDEGMGALMRQDAGDNLELLPPPGTPLEDFIADWAVANTLNDPSVGDGRYAYPTLAATVQPGTAQLPVESQVEQLGADYYTFAPHSAERPLGFQGATIAPLTAAQVEAGQQVWWSGRGDSRVATLTRTLDLTQSGPAPTLRFQLWHDLEWSYDYAYLAISEDGGSSWKALPGTSTTDEDPNQIAYGPGYSGRTGPGGDGPPAWIDEQIDLSAYAGRQVQIGFWAINDQGYNAPGMLVRNITLDGQPLAEGWQGTGFVTIANQLQQRWELRLITGDRQRQVQEIVVEDGTAEITIPANTPATLVIVATQPNTTEAARYSLTER